MPAGEVLTGIDIRPADGNIYSVSTQGSLYRLTQGGGGYTATRVAPLTVSPSVTVQVSGSNFGIDFNPVPDRLRFVTNTDQNLRINPANGVTIVDGMVRNTAGAASFDLIGAGYTNSFAGATSTVLYGIDAVTRSLVRSTDPNAGIYVTTNLAGNPFQPLGISTLTAASRVGFDILFSDGANSAFLTVDDLFYSVDLTSGAATSLGSIGVANIRGITAAVPEPGTWVMMILGFMTMGMMLRRRRDRSLAAA